MDRFELAYRLRRYLPDDAVIDQAEGLRAYETDGLTAYRRVPRVVVLPADIDEVRTVVRFCARNGVPLVPRGAGTGLSGGALPHEAGVLLVLSKMQRILEIDPRRRIARLEPGVRNLAISEAAAPHGLFYAPDPSSQIACSIGGNVAENSGGVHCLKYGLTVHNVLGVKLVTADGELLEIGGDTLDSPGLDLLAAVIGSEGLLGVVVEVTVRLLPVPVTTRVMLAAFATVEAACEAVSAVIAAGIVPAGMELMDQLAVRAAEDFVHAGYPVDAAAILICEVDGGALEVDAELARVRAIVEAAGAISVRLSEDAADRARLWAGRKAAFPAVGRIAPDYYCMDGTIPRRQLARVLTEIGRLAADAGLGVANVFHAGDGNLHPLILYDANAEGELDAAEALGARILALCVEVGGTVTGEHGVGIEKLDSMCVQFGAVELARFHGLKVAFDPAGLLNPGKAVPTLARCAELGGMHVHGGALPHPELERL
ncbi:MAG: FAD-linked oxidase C-terminal domain-containing protein [Pseudomonadales bacterium]|jgi:glycolate oxidase|nr:FAD-linked oxidase C-terminal domain-containing protein [Pseudomonadales bacterium]